MGHSLPATVLSESRATYKSAFDSFQNRNPRKLLCPEPLLETTALSHSLWSAICVLDWKPYTWEGAPTSTGQVSCPSSVCLWCHSPALSEHRVLYDVHDCMVLVLSEGGQIYHPQTPVQCPLQSLLDNHWECHLLND